MKIKEKISTVFGFTSYVWHELNRKHWLFEPVEDFIKENIVLENYTDTQKVGNLFFGFQINPPPVDKMFSYPNSFAYKKGIIFLYGKIDYETFKNATEKEALQLLCQSYLAAILTIPSLRGMKKVHFEAQKLHDDLVKSFAEKGFLE